MQPPQESKQDSFPEELLQQKHLLEAVERCTSINRACFQSVEVHSAGHKLASVVLSEPHDIMRSGAFNLILQPGNLLTKEIVDYNRHMRRTGQGVADVCGRVERIRVVLQQRKRFRNSLRILVADIGKHC